MKKFECKPNCKSVEVEKVIFGCPKCIKKRIIGLTKKQARDIKKIILNSN